MRRARIADWMTCEAIVVTLSQQLNWSHFRVSLVTAVLTPPRLSPAVREVHGDAAAGSFKDAYSLECLDLPADQTEPEPEHLGKPKGGTT